MSHSINSSSFDDICSRFLSSFSFFSTGGAGYIGSHTVIHLVKNGFKVTILDNLANSNRVILDRLEEICGEKIPFVQLSLLDKDGIDDLFKKNNFNAVIHYAALKSVGESVKYPLRYYRENVVGMLNLLDAMTAYGCKTIVYSSSATVYQPSDILIKETDPLVPSNPYGQTKLIGEQILRDLAVACPSWRISILRYFNPVGAHLSGKIGESPENPMNLLPYIQQVAVGRRPHLNVFGNDWDTPDGTGVRDYIYVEDLALGHIAALNYLLKECANGACLTHNLGKGQGLSVLELVALFEAASGKKIPVVIAPSREADTHQGRSSIHEVTSLYDVYCRVLRLREKSLELSCHDDRRPGDLASVVADVTRAKNSLDWTAETSIIEACATAWKWQSQNPYGFGEAPSTKNQS